MYTLQHKPLSRAAGVLAILAGITMAASLASAGHRYQSAACTQTARDAQRACGFEVADDTWIGIAICRNESDSDDRSECFRDTRTESKLALRDCGAQYRARRDLCGALGEDAYDPDIDPARFVDPADIGGSVAPNPYLPLIPGMIRRYEGGDETVTVTVTGETRVIAGVTVAIVRDIVEEDGEVIEDTRDWLAQDLDGNVWYFGEAVQDFEDGDLVSIDGSFKAGENGDKAGILMKAAPAAGDVYRQEFSLANAEDAAEVLTLTGSAIVPAATCNSDCLVTKDFSPLEPGHFEHKYYKPGIGPILEVNQQTGERLELVEVID